MNEIISIVLSALIVMAIGCPIATVLDKWKKKMDEDGDDDVLE